MRLVNGNLKARACHLSTRTNPKIYYRPYLLTAEQQFLIDQQVDEVQAQIDADTQGTVLNAQNTLEDGETDAIQHNEPKEENSEHIKETSPSSKPNKDNTVEED